MFSHCTYWCSESNGIRVTKTTSSQSPQSHGKLPDLNCAARNFHILRLTIVYSCGQMAFDRSRRPSISLTTSQLSILYSIGSNISSVRGCLLIQITPPLPLPQRHVLNRRQLLFHRHCVQQSSKLIEPLELSASMKTYHRRSTTQAQPSSISQSTFKYSSTNYYINSSLFIPARQFPQIILYKITQPLQIPTSHSSIITTTTHTLSLTSRDGLRSRRGRSLHLADTFQIIYEQRCKDHNHKPHPEQISKFLANHTQPEKLNLQSQNIISLNAIAKLLHGFTHLNLSHNPLNSQDLPHLANRINKSDLIHLDLSHTNIKLSTFLELLDAPTLISLNLSGLRLSDEDVELLCSRQLRHLHFLWLKNTQINQKRHTLLIENLEKAPLIYLDLSQNPLQLQFVAQSQNSLIHLNLSQCSLTDSHFLFENLEILNISANQLSKKCQNLLCHSLNKSRLTKVILDNIMFDEYFIYMLKGPIKYLSMQNCGLTLINPLIRNNRFKTLILNDNYSLEIPTMQVEYISIDRCFYTDEQVSQVILQLQKNTELRTLSMKDTHMKEYNLQLLEAVLERNNTLQQIEVSFALPAKVLAQLKKNQAIHLQLSISTYKNESFKQSIDISEWQTRISARYEAAQAQLQMKLAQAESLRESQQQQTQSVQEHLQALQNQDIHLNKEIDRIEREIRSFDIKSEADIMFYYKNIQQMKRDQTEMRNNIKDRKIGILKLKRQIIQLKDEEISQITRADQAQKLLQQVKKLIVAKQVQLQQSK